MWRETKSKMIISRINGENWYSDLQKVKTKRPRSANQSDWPLFYLYHLRLEQFWRLVKDKRWW